MSLRTSGGDLDSLASHTVGISRYEEHADRAVVEASRHDEETGFEALIDHRLHAVENESVAVGAGGSERLAGRGALLVERRSAKKRASAMRGSQAACWASVPNSAIGIAPMTIVERSGIGDG